MIIGMMDAYTPLPRFSVSTQCGPTSFLNLYAFLAFLWSSSDLETKIEAPRFGQASLLSQLKKTSQRVQGVPVQIVQDSEKLQGTDGNWPSRN